jgi:hypothetical protein
MVALGPDNRHHRGMKQRRLELVDDLSRQVREGQRREEAGETAAEGGRAVFGH